MRGRGIDYFENSRRATLRSAPTRSPIRTAGTDYGDDVWGLTACDGPADVDARRSTASCATFRTYCGARRRRSPTAIDDGTIAPTAAVGSIAVRARDRRSRRCWRCATRYGEHIYSRRTASSTRSIRSFDCRRAARSTAASFPAFGWFDTDYLGIDQGPILAMIENHRSELVWNDDAQEPAHAARPARAGLHRRLARSGRVMRGAAPRGATGAAALRRSAGGRWRCAGSLAGCGRGTTDRDGPLDFWAMGREGEVVARAGAATSSARIPASASTSSRSPGRPRTRSCSPPSSATRLPDVAQLGNTWIAGVRRARRARAARRAAGRVAGVARDDYFPGIWDTNVIDGTLYGVPWYVDTRLLFYRTRPARARPATPRRRDAGPSGATRCGAIKRAPAAAQLRRSCCRSTSTQPLVALGAAAGRAAAARRRHARQLLAAPAFRRALDFYVGPVPRRPRAARRAATQIANVWHEFARGTFAFYITGPWNLGEFRRRLPRRACRTSWATAPLPGPDGPGRLDRRRLEPRRLHAARRARRRRGSWSSSCREPERCSCASTRSPATCRRGAAPGTTPALAQRSRTLAAFREQLERVRADARRCRSGSASRTRAADRGRARRARRHDAPTRRCRELDRRRRPHAREAPLDAGARGASEPR